MRVFRLASSARRWLAVALVAGLLAACPRLARADVLQVPAGADFIALPERAVLCDAGLPGWFVSKSRRYLRPRVHTKPGTEISAKVAPDLDACNSDRATSITLITTAPHPSFDLASVTVAIDAGRIELRGERLEGAHLGFATNDRLGSDVCLNVAKEEQHEVCSISIPRDLPADPQQLQVRWAPAHGRIVQDMLLYDMRGQPLPEQRLELPIARMLLQRLFPPSGVVDLAGAGGRMLLEHPESVSEVDCTHARCEIADGSVLVSSVPANAQTLSVRVRLLPRVFLVTGTTPQSSVSEKLKVLRCPLVILSGEPPRGVDELQILVRLDAACAVQADALRWTVSSDPAEVTRVEVTEDAIYVLLWVGRVVGERVRVVASRQEDGSVLAVATVPSTEIPPPTTTLSLPGLGEIDFIPKNRYAHLTLGYVEGPGHLVPVSVPGAYEVMERSDGYHIRGVYASSGYTSLRFAYRVPQVPQAFARTAFAYVKDPVQRPIREASIPAPIGGRSVTERPVVELYCENEDGELMFLPSGSSHHIPFDERNSCRLLFHRSRIPPGSGEQHLQLTVTVTGVGNVERGEARLSEQLRLRHGHETDVIWIRGAKAQFDRIDVVITHLIDESLYAHGSRNKIALPSSQWSIVTEDADFRFYATAAIPASLYRFSSDPGDLGTGPLSLNFGVLSRLTWLDEAGHEGLVGIEGGVMAMGLATDRQRHLATVLGVGIAIPLGNPNQPTQATISIHAWLSYTVGTRTAPLLGDMGEFEREVRLNPWAFVFGPSITVGSIGVFL